MNNKMFAIAIVIVILFVGYALLQRKIAKPDKKPNNDGNIKQPELQEQPDKEPGDELQTRFQGNDILHYNRSGYLSYC